jgi:hypothetical protein
MPYQTAKLHEASKADEQYATYNEKLRDISVDKGRNKGLSWEKDVYDEDTEQTVRAHLTTTTSVAFDS